jgi:hypothetical protein
LKRKPKASNSKSTSPETLITQTDGNAAAEIKEDELKKVSGGLIALLNKQH